MADVVHRTTKQHKKSVNTPDYPTEDWIHNPDLSAVSGVLAKYWNISGDTISEMSQTEKDTVDNAVLRPWRYHCDDENIDLCGDFDSTGPTVCPNNGAHTISGKLQYNPLEVGVGKDQNGDRWCIWQNSDGNTVKTKHV